MRSASRVLAMALVAGVIAASANAEELTSPRTQVGRGATQRVGFDRDSLSGQVPPHDTSGRGQGVRDPDTGAITPADMSATQIQALATALQHIRDLNKLGLTTNAQLLAGIPTHVPPIPGLTAGDIQVLSLVQVPRSGMDYTQAGTTYILPSVHQQFFYAFDIDKILAGQYTVIPNGLLGEPDVLIPVKPVQYERIVSTSQDTGLTGGWTNNGTSGTEPHFRVPIPQYAVRSNGTVAIDPQYGEVVPLQLLGPGNWYGTTPRDLPSEYTYNPSNSTFRVAVGLNTPWSPDVFPVGGHIPCYWIHDMANPPNCQAVCRCGDPTAIGPIQDTSSANSDHGYGQYGTTVVVPVDNSGGDN